MDKNTVSNQNVCTVFHNGCFHCASTPITHGNKKTNVSKMIYHYPDVGSLLIQETTIEQILNKPKEFSQKVFEKTANPNETPTVDQASKFNLEQAQTRKLKHVWSGITFIDERDDREREKEQRANIKIMLANRKRWTRMQREIEKAIMKKQTEKCGPDWYQSLSANQLSVLESLPHVLKRDCEEKSAVNSRNFLKELGIVPLPDNRFLRDLLQNCRRDVLFFLDQIRREVRRREQQRLEDIESEQDPLSNVEMTKRKYSVSERILLSSMFTVHLPLLLFKLHLILPPAVQRSKSDGSILSPLPEQLVATLPQPQKKWFKSRKSDEPERPMDDAFPIPDPKAEQSNDDSVDGDASIASQTKMKDASVQTDILMSDGGSIELSLQPAQIDNPEISKDNKAPKTEVALADSAVTQPNGLAPEAPTEEIKRQSSPYANVNQIKSISLTPYTDYDEVVTRMLTSMIRVPIRNEEERRERLKKCLENYDIEGLYKIFCLNPKPQEIIVLDENETEKIETSAEKEAFEEGIQGLDNDENVSLAKSNSFEKKQNALEAELEKLIAQLRKAILEEPKKKRLRYALSVLANAGDPLASFPDIYKCQPIIRWYELRCGIKRKLSEKDKVVLMRDSRKAWNVLMSQPGALASLKPPTCILTTKQLASYTWEKKNWAMDKIMTATNNHKRNLSQAMVDDARILYSTMNDLHYDSSLNKNIRKTFFTYLPAAETDTCI